YLDKDHIQKLLNQLNYHSEDDMFSQVGYGEVSAIGIVNRLTEDLRKEEENKKQKELEEKILNAGQTTTEETKNITPNRAVMHVKHN
ncbi:RelA/SpoT AH/RIS domain-containing protein, partial [Lactobacillus jensenii]|uniref:RelA/SpoT AH/RIS domain-containing protein n=1 Tax=Lactobacillus jensenii TaxID=109790 RepID=UPI002870A5B9